MLGMRPLGRMFLALMLLWSPHTYHVYIDSDYE